MHPAPLNSETRKKVTFSGLRGLFVLLLVLPGASASAAEPVLTLAMVRPEARFERRLQVVREASTNTFNAPLWSGAFVPSATSETLQDLLQKPSSLCLQKTVHTTSIYPIPVARRHGNKNANPSRWANTCVEPGFGDLDCVKPARIYGRNGTGWEEPSCGYVKVHIRF